MNEKKRILSAISMYHALNDGAIVVIPLLIPIYKELFDLNYTQIGFITGGGLLITLIGQLMIGRVSDDKNSGFLLLVGVVFISFSLFLLTLSWDFISLVLFIFIFRIAVSFYHPVGIGWVSRVFKKDRLDWAMGTQSGFGDLGAFLAVLTTLYLVELNGLNFPLYIWSLIGIICLFAGLALTYDKTNKYNANKKEKNIKQELKEAKQFLLKIKLLLPPFILSGVTWSITINYFPLLLTDRTDLDLSVIGLLVAVWLGIGTIVSFSYGKIYSLIGRKRSIILAYLLIGIVGLSLSYFTNIWIILIMMVLLGISTFITYPALFSFVSNLMIENSEGKNFGYIFSIQLFGGVILLIISGILSDLWGIWVPFTILGLFSFMVTALLLVNYKKQISEDS
jgi:FSR family fosmidomycin resistance protein-like MFS transporter